MGQSLREQLARVVRQAWVDYCIETGDAKPSHLTPYDELGEWDKEADLRIAESVVKVLIDEGLISTALLQDYANSLREAR